MNTKRFCPHVLPASLLAAGLSIAAVHANAHVIGIDSGSYSAFSCDSPCSVGGSTAPYDNQISWGSRSTGNLLTGDPSSSPYPITSSPVELGATPINFTIADLAWNPAHPDAAVSFPATWTLTVKLSLTDIPTVVSINQNFALTINGTDESITFPDLTAFDSTLNAALNPYGIDVSSLAYNVKGTDSSYFSTNTRPSNAQCGEVGSCTWVDPLTNTMSDNNLWITADVAYPGSTPIPEPGSLALLGTALAGLGFLRRRRNLRRGG